ncbi:uncharacterized protein AC631_03393 [Debaryomyces fabryi]|uniref:Uncharacterized protein n=1 Tax=Debaryomyces fabryi TaxID=58627 RepID=A0A0V1PXK3_9ASCO|nr:uncharacterized protein AC631_03393 [Debaryomyces fabryi]KSA00858.1 hypothetical protein AC631_03393 [Debaryomyces fabryi]CUM45522.1 unnamed protein product [Debaryomyces fabryi]
MGIRPVSNTGNTFNGLITEFPGLGVDRFNTKAKVYLLTHCHSDHLCGLSNKSFDSRLYCSETTKKLLTLDPSFRHVLPFMITLEMNVPFTLTLNGEDLNLTLIPAYHCPGAAMFLIEGADKNVLYTGDIRAEHWWVESLFKDPSLFPYTSGLKVLDNIYLDTTFIYRGEPFIEIPLNSEGISIVTLLLKSYPRDDPDIQFYFVDSTSGFEEAWAQISNCLQGTLHTSEENRLRIKLLNSNQLYPHYGLILNDLINKAESNNCNMKFHACGKYLGSCKQDSPKFPIKIKQCIDFNILDFAGVFCPILLSSLSFSELNKELKTLGKTAKGNIIYEFRGRRWLCRKEGNELLPADIKLIFSRHSSYTECRNFVSKFKFRDIYPCTESENTWLRGMTMSRLFGDLVYNTSQSDIPLLSYDRTKSLEYGFLNSILSNRPVKIINRWKISQCIDEVRLVKRYLARIKGNSFEIRNPNSNHFNFEGQKFISKLDFSEYTEDEKQFCKERHNDMDLQKIIIGRGDAWFRKIIEDLQMLYYRYHNDIEGGVRSVLRNESGSDVQFNEGMKLGGIDRYNYGNGSILDESASDYYDSENDSHRNKEDTSSKSGIKTNEIIQGNLTVEVGKGDELTDIEDDESDSGVTKDRSIEEKKFEWELQSKRVPIRVNKHKTSYNQTKFGRPCLKRINKNSDKKIYKSKISFIESTFSSFEISFKRKIIETEDDHSVSIKVKKPSLVILANRQLSASKIYFKSCANVNSEMVQSVSNNLHDDPANWFSLKLKSVDMQLNQAKSFT